MAKEILGYDLLQVDLDGCQVGDLQAMAEIYVGPKIRLLHEPKVHPRPRAPTTRRFPVGRLIGILPWTYGEEDREWFSS